MKQTVLALATLITASCTLPAPSKVEVGAGEAGLDGMTAVSCDATGHVATDQDASPSEAGVASTTSHVATDIPAHHGTPNDITILNAVGPNTYTLEVDRSIKADSDVVSRIETGAPYTDGLNAQLVAVVRAKLERKLYVSIVGVGDSITHDGDSYRLTVNAQLLAVYGPSAPIEWEGNNDGGGALPTQYSNAIPGATTATLYNRRTQDFGPSVRQPDVIVTMTGTNDSRNCDVACFHSAQKLLLESEHTLAPKAELVVAYTPENPGSPTLDAAVTTYNKELPIIWNEVEADTGVVLHRPAAPAGLTITDMFPSPNTLHPNPTGQAKIGVEVGPGILAAVAKTGKLR